MIPRPFRFPFWHGNQVVSFWGGRKNRFADYTITPTEHIIFVIIGGAMAVGVTWFVGRNLYRLWTNRSLLTGEPLDNDFNNE